jgi:serine/threonine protein kinase
MSSVEDLHIFRCEDWRYVPFILLRPRIFQGEAKLSDFGASKLMDDMSKVIDVGSVTDNSSPRYAVPESYNNQPVSYSTDIWQMACALVHCLSNEVP